MDLRRHCFRQQRWHRIAELGLDTDACAHQLKLSHGSQDRRTGRQNGLDTPRITYYPRGGSFCWERSVLSWLRTVPPMRTSPPRDGRPPGVSGDLALPKPHHGPPRLSAVAEE